MMDMPSSMGDDGQQQQQQQQGGQQGQNQQSNMFANSGNSFLGVGAGSGSML